MNSKDVDLNLLFVFEAMVQERSVTRAAEKVGLTQSATSAALARLRTTLADPLFVKTGAEMRPTPRALALIAPVRQVLETLRGEILQTHAFDAATAERSFTVLTPDIGEINLLPGLLRYIETRAPGVNILALSMPRHAAAEALASGAADLAVGYYPDLHKAGFFQQRLFRNEHVCIVRKKHPIIGEKLTMKQFTAASHAVVRPEGREHVFEQFLQSRGIQLKVKLRVSHFMSLLPIIEGSDLIATVPRDIAAVCATHGAIRIIEPPLRSPVIDVYQFWHRRNHHDAAHVWLRSAVHGVFEHSQSQKRVH